MTTQKSIILRVFEHQRLRIGELAGNTEFTREMWAHLRYLLTQQSRPFYKIEPEGVVFGSYVGAIQTPAGLVEIWPKTDETTTPGWQPFLLELLADCGFLPTYAAGLGRLRTGSSPLMTALLSYFIDEVENWLGRGPSRRYVAMEQTAGVWKGQILWREQIKNQLTRAHEFRTLSQVYSPDNLPNQMVKLALYYAADMLPSGAIKTRATGMLGYLPDCAALHPRQINWGQLSWPAIDPADEMLIGLSKAIIQGYAGGISAGRAPAMALLFDMNRLFETFVYRQLAGSGLPELSVSRQPGRNFWLDRTLIPDLLVQYQGKKWILDTKWKILSQAKPSMDDLRQLYVYLHYFQAERGVLLYPRSGNLKDISPTPFADGKTYAQVCFIDIIENGRLARNIGKKLLEKISTG